MDLAMLSVLYDPGLAVGDDPYLGHVRATGVGVRDGIAHRRIFTRCEFGPAMRDSSN
jgi:hypothetical protein